MLLPRLYLDGLRRTWQSLRKSPWTLLLPVGYVAAEVAAAMVLAPLGLLGAILTVLLGDLLISSFLFYVAQTVSGATARPSDLGRSFAAYFLPVISFFFAWMVVTFLLRMTLAANPNAIRVQIAFWLVAAVLLNAAPEILYQHVRPSGIQTMVSSIKFIQVHWIEWFIPNIAFGVGFYFGMGALVRLPYGVFLLPPVLGAALWVVMIFRGHLFYTLDRSSPVALRQRYARPS
jgi:hypothetical protein